MERGQRRSRQEWEAVIEEQEKSGQSAREFCKSKSIGLASFYQWRKRLTDKIQKPEHAKNTEETFIDVGRIGLSSSSGAVGSSALVATLDFGDGLKLTIQRG